MGVAYKPSIHSHPTSTDYRTMYPLGTVPFIEDMDRGVAMGESVAILFYIAAAYGPTSLAPQDAKTYARVMELAIASEAGLGGPMNLLLADRFAAPAGDKGGWLSKFGTTQVERVLSHLARQMSDMPFLTGEQFTLADIAVATSLAIWERGLSGKVPDALVPWLERVRARPGYAKARQAFAGK
jgi:glutathione S-transferase